MAEVKNVPKLRFPGFTEPWEQRKLEELSSSFEYGLNAAAKEYDGENKYIRITDIDDESREFKQEDITSPDTDLSSAESYKLSEGDILFARTGASVGKSYIYKASDGLVYYAGFLIRARIKPEYNSEFVFQNTLTGNYEKFIKVTSMRSGQPGVNAQEYSQYQIMMPSKPEQDKISDCLRNLDNLITLHQRKYETLLEYKKGLLQKMFPKAGETVPEIRFPGFDEEWEEKSLNDCCSITTGNSNAKDALPNGNYRFFDRGLNEIKFLDTYYLDKEAIIYAGEGSEFLPRYYNGKFALHQRCYALYNFNSGTNVRFLFSFLETKSNHFVNTSVGSTVPSLRIDSFSTCRVKLPKALEEQQKIGSFFKSLDEKIELQKQKVDAIKEYKKGLLQQMFV